MWSVEQAKYNSFVFSETLDIVAFTFPVLLSICLSPVIFYAVDPDSMPLWGYISVVVFSDVSHVWSTLFRTHFDSRENKRRCFLYNHFPFFLFASQSILHFFAGDAFFWTLIGYLAIFHFLKQQYGFLMIAKCREKNSDSLTRDNFFFYSLALFPIFLWHFDSSRHFDWFNRDDPFLVPQIAEMMSNLVLFSAFDFQVTPFRLMCALWICIWVYFFCSMISDYKSCERLNQRFPLLRTLLLLYSGITWSVGVLVGHKMIGLLFLNLFHALPAFLIAFCSSMNRWKLEVDAERLNLTLLNTVGSCLTKNKNRFPLYLGLLFFLGATEELFWEIFVWRDYLDLFDWIPDNGKGYYHPAVYSLLVSLLILPQTTHYVLDMYIWKLGRCASGDELNPRLRQYLGISQ